VSDGDFQLASSREVHRGHAFRLAVETWRMPDGSERDRDVVHHTGAVGVVALDERERVLLIRQFRPAVRRHLLELPAGLLDEVGEPASVAAARELAEEADLVAGRWHVLLDAYTSPGMSDEAVRIYLARDVTAAPSPYSRVDEEADLQPRWLPLADAVDLVTRGELTNSLAVLGVLATARARDTDWSGLRPVDAAWDARPGHRG